MERGETEQNKTEEPTPFKLKRARERGVVARGVDLGYFSVLSALTLFVLIAGESAIGKIAGAMRGALIAAPSLARDTSFLPNAAAALSVPALQAAGLLVATALGVVLLFEIIQARGIVFTGHPLKPDFNRLNPAQGFKRLFSMRMLKETLKNILKMVAYGTAAFLVTRAAFENRVQSVGDSMRLSEALHGEGLRLLLVFALLALIFAAIDQVLSRAEFLKQMRMTRSELTREHKEREGEPRLKQKRKQMHAEFVKQTRALGDLRGSDMLIVNPQHFAVALRYKRDEMTAPRVTAKGRNRFALLLKRKAALVSVAIFESPALARALYAACDKGDEIPAAHYAGVADLYLKLMRAAERTPSHANA